ncbi:hypothetical protein SLS62_007832 [Diatrype stigma]|uniref:Uncharacterized protein n=1 Tax=Diatrype stigma TaxID=117547 RepID=A0AAN9UYL0_9PEZI
MAEQQREIFVPEKGPGDTGSVSGESEENAADVLVLEIVVFDLGFPSDTTDVKFRAVQWICTEVMLALAVLWNLLPLATSRTIGFRSAHDAFMTTYNGTGAPDSWNWCLSYLATAGILIGFDASGHVAEETKNAAVTAARGIFWSTVVSGIGGFIVVVLFLFCVISKPDADKFFEFGGPQPFVPLYAVILGEGGHIFMNIVCVVALWFVPFTSLVSAAGVPSAAAYGLICLGRLFLTPKTFPKPAWSLGRLSKPFQAIAVLWNGWVVAVLYSPYIFPVDGQTLNYAPVIMAIVTVFALLSWWFFPAERWLPSQRIQQTLEAEGAGSVEKRSGK